MLGRRIEMKEVRINTDYIRLDQFLKLVNEAQSGGDAKVKILSSEVKLNGITQTQRGKKLRDGDEISIHGRSYKIVSA